MFPSRGAGDAVTNIMAQTTNPFGAEAVLSSKLGDLKYFALKRLTESGIGHVDDLPFSIKVLLESCLRNTDNFEVTEEDVRTLAAWNAPKPKPVENRTRTCDLLRVKQGECSGVSTRKYS